MGDLSVKDIRDIAKWLYFEYTGIWLMIGGSVVLVVVISIPTIFANDPLLPVYMTSMSGPVVLSAVLLLLGILIYEYSKRKSNQLNKRLQ